MNEIVVHTQKCWLKPKFIREAKLFSVRWNL